MTPTLIELRDALGAHGLILRGGFHPVPADDVPPLTGGRAVRTLMLAGHGGPAMWLAFQASSPAGTHPLDGWSREVLGGIARKFDGGALLPGDGPPYLPFQRWAIKADAVSPSPIGVLIHPDFGLWHGYRGALIFAETLALPPADERPSPCETCTDRPCLSTCPVGAFSTSGYDVPRCVDYLDTPAGVDCLEIGCRARRACPIGRDATYTREQAAFHMAAFHRTNRKAP